MSGESSEREFLEQWETLGGDALATDWVSGTTLGSAHASAASLSSLPEIALSGAAPALELGPVLGEGGVGVVLEARQIALDRMVVVKCPRADRDDDAVAATLVREARIAGALEHPNVVPVHGLGRGPDGRPLVVMARIEGVSWRALLRDPEHPIGAQLEGDALERGLRILMQVCHATHFAHCRGVLHRDLKPDNVMLGRFGEVYLVDWGLALRLDEAVTCGLAGTPGYMAPEMVRDGAPLDARTDVYLLGAVLFELLTGRRLHSGRDLYALSLAAHRARMSALPDDTPPELVEIVTRACARDPAARFETAESLRRALADFLVHRDALALIAGAEARLALLREAEDGAAEGHFAAARFGFTEGLRAWPESERARAGFRGCVEHMVRRELGRGEPGAARRLLAELPEPPPELSREVRAAVAELDEIRAEARGRDARLGLRSRAALNTVLLVVFGVAPFVLGRMRAGGLLPADPPPLQRAPAALVAGVLVLLSLRLRVRVLDSGYNRRVVSALGVAVFAAALLWTAAGLLGLDFRQTLPLVFAVLFTLSGTLGAALDRRFFALVPIYAAGGLAAAWRPQLAEELLGIANALGIAWLVFTTRPGTVSSE